jgi:hypothetical protein
MLAPCFPLVAALKTTEAGDQAPLDAALTELDWLSALVRRRLLETYAAPVSLNQESHEYAAPNPDRCAGCGKWMLDGPGIRLPDVTAEERVVKPGFLGLFAIIQTAIAAIGSVLAELVTAEGVAS